MKLTMKKTLVAATVALMAVSGAANAAANLGKTGLGSSDLIFTAWDATAGTGYTFDLSFAAGLNGLVGADTSSSSATAGTAPTYGVAAAPAGGIFYTGALTGFSTYLTSTNSVTGAATSLANVNWELNAADALVRNRYLTTVNSADLLTAPLAPTNTQVGGAGSAFQGGTNIALGTGGQGTYATYDDASQTIGTQPIGFANATPLLLGDTANLQLAAQNSTLSTGANNASFLGNVMVGGQQVAVSTFQNAGVWNVQIAQVAAVPEADTYAMFLAGLGLMGFVARRRMQA